MEAFLLCLLSIIIIDVCSARVVSHSGGSSSSSLSGSDTAAIVVSVICGSFLLFIVVFCLIKKYSIKQRMGILPSSTNIGLAQQENQYAPPVYNQVPPYGQPYGQPPPYGQFSPYEQPPPPPYSAPSAPTQPT